MTFKRLRLRPIAAVVGLVLLAGCSTLPTAPITNIPADANDGTSATVTNSSDPLLLGGIGRGIRGIVGGVGGIVGGVVGGVGGVVPVLAPITTIADSLVRSLLIVGTQGGTIENGKVTVVIPPGAIRGSAEVKVIVPDSTSLSCHLEINPPTANGFDIPVTLRFKAADLAHVERYGVAWFNPATQQWEVVESQVNPQTGLIEAPLPHFSEYRVQEVFKSKAGW